jgi:hypothetical protein
MNLDLVIEVDRSFLLSIVCLDVRYLVLGILQGVHRGCGEQEVDRLQALTGGFLR